MFEDTRTFRRPNHRPSQAVDLTPAQIGTMSHADLMSFTAQDLRMIAGRVGTYANGGATKTTIAHAIIDARLFFRVDEFDPGVLLCKGTAYQCEFVDGTIGTYDWLYGRTFQHVDTRQSRDIAPSNVVWFSTLADASK